MTVNEARRILRGIIDVHGRCRILSGECSCALCALDHLVALARRHEGGRRWRDLGEEETNARLEARGLERRWVPRSTEPRRR